MVKLLGHLVMAIILGDRTMVKLLGHHVMALTLGDQSTQSHAPSLPPIPVLAPRRFILKHPLFLMHAQRKTTS